jgi:hypothetical protein
MQNGYTKAEAEELDPAERRAVVLVVGLQNGSKVNWTNATFFPRDD